MNITTALQETPEVHTQIKPSKKDGLMKGELRYSIASVQACHRNPNAIELRIQVKGTRATFSKRLDEVYTENGSPTFHHKMLLAWATLYPPKKKQIKQGSTI